MIYSSLSSCIAKVDTYKDVKKLPDYHRYFDYQKFMSGDPDKNPSHLVVKKAIERLGQDYRSKSTRAITITTVARWNTLRREREE